jgi:hypothetical protein
MEVRMRQAGLAAFGALALLVCAIPAASAYTAVAVSESRAFGYCNNAQSIGEASNCAMRYCQQSASDPQTCAIGLQSEPTGHYSLATGGGAWGVASGESQADADRSALDYCKTDSCQVVARWTEGVVRGQ